MNNKRDMQNNNTEGHLIHNGPNNGEQTGNIKQTTNGNRDKPDDALTLRHVTVD